TPALRPPSVAPAALVHNVTDQDADRAVALPAAAALAPRALVLGLAGVRLGVPVLGAQAQDANCRLVLGRAGHSYLLGCGDSPAHDGRCEHYSMIFHGTQGGSCGAQEGGSIASETHGTYETRCYDCYD